MSALMVDDVITRTRTPSRVEGARVHALHGPATRPRVTPFPGRRPDGGVAAPALGAASTRPGVASRPELSGWRLTDRGIAVVVTLFLALCLTAAVVLVTNFLAVSNEPPLGGAPVTAANLGAS